MNPGLCDPRVRNGRPKSPHWACNRHISKVGFYAGLVKPAPLTVSNGRVYSLPPWNYMRASSVILSEPSGSMPCVASSAITWVNLPTVGGQPTQMYQLMHGHAPNTQSMVEPNCTAQTGQ